MGCGQNKIEPGALAFDAMYGDHPVVSFDDLFRYSKTYARAFEFIFCV